MVTTPAASTTALDAARAVADAVLYEGYLLYPYRRSSGKNRVRWQFGVLFPPDWARAHGLDETSLAGSAESWWQQTECLAEVGPDAGCEVRLRFLQLQHRRVEERLPGGTWRPAGELTVEGRRELSFDEAIPQEVTVHARLAGLLTASEQATVRVSGGTETAALTEGGQEVGRVVRHRLPVTASVRLSAARCEVDGLVRLRVEVRNTGAVAPQSSRDEALRVSMLACHLLLGLRGGAFVSLLDPPVTARAAARSCRNVHTFPVLAGPAGQRGAVLSSPVILYDYPQVAPESPGDLHDATEIDELLSLRALTLTDAEKQEARATDRRAAEILDRVGAMPPEAFARLHGAVRSLRPVPAGARRPPAPAPEPATAPEYAPAPGAGASPGPGDGREGSRQVPRWDPGADAAVSPETDSVTVAGIPVARGSLVRLWPRRRGTDPQDMFLAGRIARVEAVLCDVDGSRYLAVTLGGDPAAELSRVSGRYRHFRPEEVEPLPGRAQPGPAATGRQEEELDA